MGNIADCSASNPTGRPRGRHLEAPYEAVLGQMVTIREGGTERRVTAAEAVLLQLAKRGLEGDGAAARASLAMIEEYKSAAPPLPSVIVWVIVDGGSVTYALMPLRMAKKCESAWGPDADRHAKLLIWREAQALLDAYLQSWWKPSNG